MPPDAGEPVEQQLQEMHHAGGLGVAEAHGVGQMCSQLYGESFRQASIKLVSRMLLGIYCLVQHHVVDPRLSRRLNSRSET